MLKNRCPYCGNNPVPHLLTWYFETLDMVLAPLRRFVLYNPLSGALKKLAERLDLSWLVAMFFLKVKILSLQPDISKCKIRRAQVLWEEAQKRGIKMSQLMVFGFPLDVYLAESKKSKVKGQKLIFDGLPRPKALDGKRIDEMDDKFLLKRRLAQAGLPVPLGGSAATVSGALKIFRSIQSSPLRINDYGLRMVPAIVKPRTGSRGRHTTTFVSSDENLKKAVKIARQLCQWVVVEEQLFGPVYRATVIGGKLAGVLRGDPPQVAGDGKSSIGELINARNSQPHPGVKDIIPDDSMKLFLSRQSLSLSSVPEAGRLVSLSEKIGVNYGGASSEDYDICHDDNKELFLRAAEAVGAPIVGFDFIIPDISQSYKIQPCGFIEANSLPFINLHHDPLRGKPRNAAALVWDLLEW